MKAGGQGDRACGLWGPSAPHEPSWERGRHVLELSEGSAHLSRGPGSLCRGSSGLPDYRAVGGLAGARLSVSLRPCCQGRETGLHQCRKHTSAQAIPFCLRTQSLRLSSERVGLEVLDPAPLSRFSGAQSLAPGRAPSLHVAAPWWALAVAQQEKPWGCRVVTGQGDCF